MKKRGARYLPALKSCGYLNPPSRRKKKMKIKELTNIERTNDDNEYWKVTAQELQRNPGWRQRLKRLTGQVCERKTSPDGKYTIVFVGIWDYGRGCLLGRSHAAAAGS